MGASSTSGSLRHGLNFAGIGQSVTFSRPHQSLSFCLLSLCCVYFSPTHSLNCPQEKIKKPFTALVRIACHFYYFSSIEQQDSPNATFGH
ncbi:hypothetical protein BDV30DRAFT_217085 [Aspergillus minisclerotigenes]|uniref:Uncharacterized protein n=1 Tax=Aspergillus minisclerotigenes TaxID=656917 RepID=A0A5N6IVL6_9EURO|nr:hypothetical protein BDV30DRAFT_217085 [Aspergillus minisclerotigenes]